MSDLYRHHHDRLSAAEEDNLICLARYLVRCAPLLWANRRLEFSPDPRLRMPLSPQRAVDGRKLPPMMPLALGPAAGIAAGPGEGWAGYVQRAFGIAPGSLFEGWLQDAAWGQTDPTPIGAALRIAYRLDYGVPQDWRAIASGRKGSDYPTNYFLRERIDVYWELHTELAAEFTLEWTHLGPIRQMYNPNQPPWGAGP